MSAQNGLNDVPQEHSASEQVTEGGLRAPPGLSTLGKLWWWFHFLILVKIARLRFIGALCAIGAVIVYWDTLKAYYDRWTRPAVVQAAAETDTEYFCPMHPSIVRANPQEKCPLCFMPLSKRKKGAGQQAIPLSPGTVSRVQLSPYRVVLAGIETYEVAYRPLVREITTVGTVEFDERKLSRITARAGGRSRIDRLYLNVTGQTVHQGDPLALLYSPELATTAQNLIDAQQSGNTGLVRLAAERLRLWGIDDAQIAEIQRTGQPVIHLTVRSPITGQVIRKYQVEGEYVEEGARLYDVADLSTVWIEAQVYENQLPFIKEGMTVSATTVASPDHEFKGRVALLQPQLDTLSRTLRVRFDMDNAGRELRPGMFATVKLEVSVSVTTGETGGASPGQVLAVPEGAVIDTGSRKIVYRETAPGTYEGVEVKLGPRCDLFYPVLHGLAAGERVVTAGSFLVDAETRLNPAAGSIYFGGSGGKAGPSAVTARDDEADIREALSQLSPEDRRLAEAQRMCPIRKERLGAMGPPVRITLNGRIVFLCCEGCRKKAEADPQGTLRQVEAGK
jgi:multidrug efflux pump subunit AcrA (membrane-fusion protein)